MSTAAVIPFPEQEEFSLAAIVRELLDSSDEANPHALAADLLGSLSDDVLRAALLVCLPDYIAKQCHRASTRTPAQAPGSARWDNVAAVASDGLFRRRLWTPSGWKHLGDCSRADLLGIAEQRQELAEANAAAAENFTRLANAMKRDKAERVGDLPVERVRRLLNA